MKSLVINAGSSSIKFQVFDQETSILSGLCESIGLENSKIKIKFNGKKEEINLDLENHKIALEKVIEILKEKNLFDGIENIIHRVVHGGEKFIKTTKITPEVMEELKKLIPLAPLHNPANIEGIEAIEEILPEIEQFAVFDTAFHTTMPEESYLYSVPYSWYKNYGVRRYGFHGSSHQYVIGEAIKKLKKRNLKIISCHLGNGASICAAIDGKAVDTSMGMTPLEGLAMGTRSGTIDPGIIEYMANRTNMNIKEIMNVLNKESGLKGISELTSDMRPLEENMEICEKSKRAMGVYLHRLERIVGAHLGVLGGCDAIIFTGGAGEKSPILRKHLAEKLKFLGIVINEEKNKNNFGGEITKPESKIKIFVIPTNEELQMVRNVKNLK
ncbi:MAG TPA: acetate kinase [Candidatus Nanoarchaeia archaeon]|nr:acetate kinase [Candidatus Nanoarchaeia archaeon]